MATTSLQSLHHHSLLRQNHHHYSDTHSSSSSSVHFSLFLKPATTANTTISLSYKLSPTHFSLFSTTSSSPATTADQTTDPLTTTSGNPVFELLEKHLAEQNFRQADEETRRLIIVLAGEPAQKRGYVFFSEVQFIPVEDLLTMDKLWRQYSDEKFGYSVQKKIWQKQDEDFSNFFRKVGWMKKLDTEIEQYNYRSFPTEFIWELNDDTPAGHLPLTNALRGTQLLKYIFNHPAFETADGEMSDGEEQSGESDRIISKPFSKKLFSTDYSF
ncbi:tetrapyrrole-binding protein, chloroplastic-like [Papaver somniferum]|uniref:tetrapyrrole-binding protein, chloroplastic-like n=1 Tax=Papaver somniferum TaxID=3469 RepID=UPI000E703B23|nr:tetrapyrrole-binding protein, chloroplastic-like [Papaver somniferum]